MNCCSQLSKRWELHHHYTIRTLKETYPAQTGKPHLASGPSQQPLMDTHQALETANTSNNRHKLQPIRMKRARDSHVKVAIPRDNSHQLGGPMRPPPRPIPTIAEIDAETHHILPEKSWFGPEFQNRAAPWEESYSEADTHHTGAFTVWGPETVDLPEESRPYATDASRLDRNITKEEERRARAMLKGDQLVRHGLVVGDHDHLRPLLALPDISHKEEERRKQTGQRLVDRYVYESSEDDAAASQPPNDSRKKPKKGRLVKLKQALAKLDIPIVSDEQDESRPTLGFQKAMQRDNPRRPIRSQANLLAISYTDPVEYFGEDLQTLLESDAYHERVGRAIARLLPHSRLS